MWQPLVNFLPKKFCKKGHCVFCHTRSRIILSKNFITLILMQKCHKLLNNIAVYSAVIVTSKKKIGPNTRLRKAWWFSELQKHDNFVYLCSHLNETRLHHWKECIEHRNITTSIALKPSTKLGFFWWIGLL